ncbi:MAG: hypothetical protein JRJ74_15955 [Deltaproteobacteria bacterium]|nr:hypothetical protein [Deltaproteobacteria bacterium]
MSIMMELLEDHLNTLHFLTEDEMPEYIRDRAVFMAELEKVEIDEEQGKFISVGEMFKEMDRLFTKYGAHWVELIEDRNASF